MRAAITVCHALLFMFISAVERKTDDTTSPVSRRHPAGSVERHTQGRSKISIRDASGSSVSTTTQATTCDKSCRKYEIKRFLDNSSSTASAHATKIHTQCGQLNSNNVDDIGQQMAAELRGIQSTLKSSFSSIQTCGIDPTPLQANQGVSVYDVSSAAYQVVTTLKPTFIEVSQLFKQYPTIEQSCSETLTNVSTSLSSLVGACSEQINLFDVGFFKLVTPEMAALADISNNFSGFVGSFVS